MMLYHFVSYVPYLLEPKPIFVIKYNETLFIFTWVKLWYIIMSPVIASPYDTTVVNSNAKYLKITNYKFF